MWRTAGSRPHRKLRHSEVLSTTSSSTCSTRKEPHRSGKMPPSGVVQENEICPNGTIKIRTNRTTTAVHHWGPTRVGSSTVAPIRLGAHSEREEIPPQVQCDFRPSRSTTVVDMMCVLRRPRELSWEKNPTMYVSVLRLPPQGNRLGRPFSFLWKVLARHGASVLKS